MKRAVYLLICMLLIAAPSYAAVSYDTSASTDGSEVTSLSITNYTATCATSDALLLVGVSYYWSGATVSSATYNSQALSLVSAVTHGDQGRVELWQKVAPTLGTAANVVVNFSTSTDAVVGAISFCGVDQATALGTPITQTGLLMDISDSVTIPANGMGFEVMHHSSGTGFTAVTGTVERWNLANAGGGQTRATTGNMGWTMNDDYQYTSHIAVPINPASAPPAVKRGAVVILD